MNYKLLSSSLSIVLAIFLIIKNTLDFNPIRFHCENYVLNSYLYLFLTLAIAFSTIFSLESFKVTSDQLFTGNTKFLLLILSFILIFSVTMVSPRMFLLKHTLWILFIILLGIFMYPLFKEKSDVFYHAGISTATIVTILSVLAFTRPDLIKDSWFMPLFIGLIALIISQILERILAYNGIVHETRYNKMLSYVSIVLFSLFTLYDTKQIIKNANQCVNPDYINQSLDLFLDSLNIFTAIANINE